MRRIDNVLLVGTSHIAKQSVDKVRHLIETENPGIIALELDARRYYALTHKEKSKKYPNPFRVGFKGLMFSIFGSWAENKLGKFVGVSPGTEMVTAGELARKMKKKLVFIDQDIEITLRRLSQELTWKEKGRFIADIVKSFFTDKDSVQIDLTKVPGEKMIEQLLSQVKKRYPNIYKVLVEERNIVMAERLRALKQRFPDEKIIAIVGAGHLDEISDLLTDDISYEFNFKA